MATFKPITRSVGSGDVKVDRSVDELRRRVNLVMKEFGSITTESDDSVATDLSALEARIAANEINIGLAVNMSYADEIATQSSACQTSYIADDQFGSQDIYTDSGRVYYNVDFQAYDLVGTTHTVRLNIAGNVVATKVFNTNTNSFLSHTFEGVYDTGSSGVKALTITHARGNTGGTECKIQNRLYYFLGG